MELIYKLSKCINISKPRKSKHKKYCKGCHKEIDGVAIIIYGQMHWKGVTYKTSDYVWVHIDCLPILKDGQKHIGSYYWSKRIKQMRDPVTNRKISRRNIIFFSDSCAIAKTSIPKITESIKKAFELHGDKITAHLL